MQQAQNKSNNVMVEVGGQRMPLAAAERLLGIGYGSINQRVRKIGDTNQKATDHFAHRRAMMLGLQSPTAGNA
jgi:hypothetical protein